MKDEEKLGNVYGENSSFFIFEFCKIKKYKCFFQEKVGILKSKTLFEANHLHRLNDKYFHYYSESDLNI